MTEKYFPHDSLINGKEIANKRSGNPDIDILTFYIRVTLCCSKLEIEAKHRK